MKKASISEIKNRLSAFLRKVKAGKVVVIMDRDQPVARIERIGGDGRQDDRLRRLEQAGLLRRARSATKAGGLQGDASEGQRERARGLARGTKDRTVKFCDASAIVPLLLDDTGRAPLIRIMEQDPVILAWWGTPVECISAIARRAREGAITRTGVTSAIQPLRALGDGWQEVLPSEAVRTTAQRLLRVHALRAADALQLAAAVVASEHEAASLPFVSLDERLNEAATREGFHVLPAV